MRTLISTFVLAFLVCILCSSVHADVPQKINYQGKLTNPQGGLIKCDTVQIQFNIYDSETGGTSLWSETHQEVIINNGLFSVVLGSQTTIPQSVFNGDTRYLGITVESDPQVTPRTPMVSVGYAFRAELSDTADYARVGQPDDDWTIAGDNIYRLEGNVGIGTDSPGDKLEVYGGGNILLKDDANDPGDVVFQNSVGTEYARVYSYNDGTLRLSGGSNTDPEITITDDGVGIGTTTPGYDLDVGGAVNATTYYGDGSNLTGIGAGQWTDAGTYIYANNATDVVVTDDARVGIGTTDPIRKLQVEDGDIFINTSSDVGGGAIYFDGPPGWTNSYYIKGGREDDNRQMYIGSRMSEAKIAFQTWSGDFQFSSGNPEETRMIIKSAGNVGIGTTNPGKRLTVQSDGAAMRVQSTGSGRHNYVEYFIDGPPPASRSAWVGYSYNGAVDFTIENEKAGGDIVLETEGNVGIGTATPGYKLDVNGDIHGTSSLRLDNASHPNVRLISYNGGDYRWEAAGGNFYLYDETATAYRIFMESEGRLGIGTTSPAANLHIVGAARFQRGSGGYNFLEVTADASGVYLTADDPDNNQKPLYIRAKPAPGIAARPIHLQTDNATRMTIHGDGNVGVGTTTPDARLTVKAAADGKVLKGYNQSGEVIVEIGEGLDYSETFPTAEDDITPGMVMVIDPVNTGNLTVSAEPYDTKVAGIIAGANGLGSGVRLGSRYGDNGDHTVALAGRVYCNVDTKYGDVKPGDLLTTSPTPGHAMIVKDYSKAQGAILGKAMDGFSGGDKGQILVLVTLQ